MKKLHLTIATQDYDHFRDFRTGEVRAEGIEHTWLMPELHEIFARFTANREWDVSELSFAKFAAQVTRKNPDILALPVVCSRHFRFSAFFVNKKSKIKSAKDLKGKKVGSPEWAHTAAVYMRGWLGDECGVALKDVHWYQAGLNQPGRTEKVELSIPKGVKLTRVEDKSLSDMLAKGEIDCALVARPPDCFMKGHPDVERLFPNYLEMEEQYYARTKVWPIMHVIAIKKSILDRDPWVAGSLYNAFVESKERSIAPAHRRHRVTLSAALAHDLCADACATSSTAIPSPTASTRTARRSSSSCATPTSRASRTATPRSTTSSRRE